MSEREAEIAAKIANLRRLNRLQSQRGGAAADAAGAESRAEGGAQGAAGDGGEGGGEGGAAEPRSTPLGLSFDSLPDWKKKEVLMREMDNAEAFFGVGEPAASPGAREDTGRAPGQGAQSGGRDAEARGGDAGGGGEEVYKPKVGTWGVFPRPDNISKAYGGGRKIPIGGKRADPDDPAARQRQRDIDERLARYRKGQGIDMERERAHEEEIAGALAAADGHMRGAFAYKAVEELEAVQGFVSPRSRRGGDVYLALAMAYEATGQREQAKGVYVKLRRSPFQDVSRKARQLLAGFDAMETMRVELDSGAADGKLRVGAFELPDVAAYTDKRYDTAVYVPKPKRRRDGAPMPTGDMDVGMPALEQADDDSSRRALTIALLGLIAVPLLIIAGTAISR